MNELDLITPDPTAELKNRRSLLSTLTAAGLGMGLLSLNGTAGAAMMKMG